jgi:hypothetical protein
MATYLPANVVSDPDSLSAVVRLTNEAPGAGDEVFIDTVTKKIQLRVTGALTIHGVTLKCLYSFLKEEWKDNANLIQFPFPMTPITDEQFEFYNGWNLDNANTTGAENQTSAQLVRTGGWAVKKYDSGTDTNGNDTERWASVITLGTLGDATTSTDQVYFQQVDSLTTDNTTNFKLTGPVNQAIQFYSDPNGDANTADGYSYSQFLKLFCREWAKTYASSALNDIGVTTLTYQAYRFPLTNSADAKIVNLGVSEANAVGAISPYNNMTIKWYTTGQERTGFTTASSNAGSAFFKVIIDADAGNSLPENPTAEQIYAHVQAQLRLTTNINDGSSTAPETNAVKIGKVVPEKLRFIGDDLFTLGQTSISEGVFIDDYNTNDTNRLRFWGYGTASGGTEYTTTQLPFTATLRINFGDNLKNDSNSIYRVFFTNDDAGNNSGRDFGTKDAILVLDKSGNTMAGFANTTSVTLTYDYDGNVQRGAGSNNTPVPITVVAIGLGTAQYVKATGTIERTVTNSLSLVAPLERNYSNP